MHRLKYFSTRACSDPLAVPVNGAVDEQDARHAQCLRFLLRRPQLLGKAVRAALYRVTHQVALLHSGGCSHNDISLRSLCLVVNGDGTPSINQRDGSVTLLLTRFGYATEFLSDREHAVDVEETSGSPSTKNNDSSTNSSSVSSVSHQLARATRRSAQSAKLAIAPNILAICDVDGIQEASAEKHHRAFHARQDAESHSRAQGRRPLPLSTPICGPTADVQGLAAVAAALFRHLIDAADEIMGHKEVAFRLQHKGLFSRNNNNNNNNNDGNGEQQLQQQQQQAQVVAHASASDPKQFANHRFWSCDVEPALRKYITGTSRDYYAKVHEWMTAAPRNANSSSSNYNCSFKVRDEVIASAQLATFRIEVPTQIKEQQLQMQSHAVEEEQEQGGNDSDSQRCSISTSGAPAIELRWLLSRVLLQQRLPLPSAAQLAVHPFFWSALRTAQFMVAAAQFLCEEELIAETLRSFCGSGSGGGSASPQGTSGAGAQHHQDRASAVSGSSRESNNTNSKKKDGSAAAGVAATSTATGSAAVVIDNSGQNDPDGAAAKAAEKLRSALKGSPFAGLGSGLAASQSRKAAVAPGLQDAYDDLARCSRNDELDLSAITHVFDAAAHSASLARSESMLHLTRTDSLVHQASSPSFSAVRGGGGGGGGVLKPPQQHQQPQHPHPHPQQQQQQHVDEEAPPNSIARLLNTQPSLYWWAKGEFRSDTQSHKDNCAVWLRMLADVIGSSSHPFSTANTSSGRIRNSRSDLLLFIAVIIAKLVGTSAGGAAATASVKICSGDAFAFVSLAVHSRFPGLQMLLIELISRRQADAQKFCHFVAEQENAVQRQPALALPLFAATSSLWTSSSSGLPPFGEELAQMFTFWS